MYVVYKGCIICVEFPVKNKSKLNALVISSEIYTTNVCAQWALPMVCMCTKVCIVTAFALNIWV